MMGNPWIQAVRLHEKIRIFSPPMLSAVAVAFMISSTKSVAHRAVLGVATMVRERDFVNNKAQRIISPARRAVVEAHRTCGSCPQRA